MWLGKRVLLAILFTVVGLTADGRGTVGDPICDAPAVNAWSRALTPATAGSSWHDSERASKPGSGREAFGTRGEAVPASLLPVQFKYDPKNLGVGKVLVASRGLGDPHFAKTVILLIHYDEKGVVGVVLNRRTTVPLSQVLDLKAAKDRPDPIYLGGPVEPAAVFALVQSAAKLEKAENIFAGVYWINDKALLEQTIAGRPDSSVFRVYLGYAGWTPDQLRAEVQVGAWFVFPGEAATVFNADPDSLWMQKIQQTEMHLAKAEPLAESSRFIAVDQGLKPESLR